MYNTDEYIKIIRERLSDYRFYHSVCVAESAKALAQKYGADPLKAEVAGILHDATKESSKQEQLELIEKAGMTLTDFERDNFKFYHQISGAAFAKVELGITDDEIISSIRYHTTGCENMTLMNEIIYLADFISADRTYDDVDKMRENTEKGKEYGLLYSMKYTIKSNLEKNRTLHPDTVYAYNWVLNNYFNNSDTKGRDNE